MKVIKKGEVPRYRFKCPTCNTEFEFDLGEIKQKTFELGLVSISKLYFCCPLCHHAHIFDTLKDIRGFKLAEGIGRTILERR